MGFFSSTVAAQLAGQVVRCAILVHFDFTSNPMRIWSGFGDIEAGGHTWTGIGQLGSISGMEAAIGGIAPVTTFTLSGVDPVLLAETLNASDEVKGRDVTVFVQFFDEELTPLDSPYTIYAGTLDVMSLSMTGPSQASIEVTSETVFTRHGLPMWGSLSDADQNRLHPGDRGLEMIAQVPFKTAIWPIIEQTSK